LAINFNPKVLNFKTAITIKRRDVAPKQLQLGHNGENKTRWLIVLK
jgi:hypothetical protein